MNELRSVINMRRSRGSTGCVKLQTVKQMDLMKGFSPWWRPTCRTSEQWFQRARGAGASLGPVFRNLVPQSLSHPPKKLQLERLSAPPSPTHPTPTHPPLLSPKSDGLTDQNNRLGFKTRQQQE